MKTLLVFATGLLFALVPANASAQTVGGGLGSGSGNAKVSGHDWVAAPGSGSTGGSGGGGGVTVGDRMCLTEWPNSQGEMIKVLIPCDAYDANSPTVGVPVQDAAGDPAADAGQLVSEFVRTLAMPVPQPQMSAPEGITGAVHSLDLQTPTTKSFTTQIDGFGRLTATAHGNFSVDWGDGTVENFRSAGAPWPRSDLEHSWSDAGGYTVVVNANWVLDWQLGEFSGVIPGLSTSASIPGWSVVQAQSVIVR